MAISRKPLPIEQGQPTVNLKMTYDDRLRRMEEQKTLAREMIQTAREMSDRAAKMRTPPHFVLP